MLDLFIGQLEQQYVPINYKMNSTQIIFYLNKIYINFLYLFYIILEVKCIDIFPKISNLKVKNMYSCWENY